jgi:putative membrane protein
MQNATAWRRVLGVSIVAALAGALAVHAQAQTDKASAGKGAKTGQGSTSGTSKQGSTASGGSMSRSDQQLLADMAMENMAEIDTAHLAQSRSHNEQIKNFAQQMIDDHTRALNEVQELARTKGVTLPESLDSRHKTAETKLASLSGDAFDRAYLARAGVDEHRKAHSQLKQVETRAKDPDLKALAAKTLPTVDQHLNSVQQIQNSKGGSKG